MARNRERFGPGTRRYLSDLKRRWATATSGARLPRVLVHADLAPEHLIMNKRGALVSVLDFSGPQITDPAIDIASIGEYYGWPFADLVLANYGAANDAEIRTRAHLYARVLPLHAVEARVARGDPALLRHGLR
jgi:aminoglycoside phosphotransferase (APT) family kinase protein